MSGVCSKPVHPLLGFVSVQECVTHGACVFLCLLLQARCKMFVSLCEFSVRASNICLHMKTTGGGGSQISSLITYFKYVLLTVASNWDARLLRATVLSCSFNSSLTKNTWKPGHAPLFAHTVWDGVTYETCLCRFLIILFLAVIAKEINLHFY